MKTISYAIIKFIFCFGVGVLAGVSVVLSVAFVKSVIEEDLDFDGKSWIFLTIYTIVIGALGAFVHWALT